MHLCYNLTEYNPFEPIITYEIGYWGDVYIEIDSQPMEIWDWEEWLEVNGND